LFNSRIFRTVEARLHFVDIDGGGLDLAEQDHIVALAIDCISENHSVREGFQKSGDLTLHSLLVALIELNELCDHAARIQVFFRDLKKFTCVERGGTFHPGIKWIGRNTVELLLGRQQIVTPIVDAHLDFRVTDDIKVVLRKMR
jgi:hypothetical protein